MPIPARPSSRTSMSGRPRSRRACDGCGPPGRGSRASPTCCSSVRPSRRSASPAPRARRPPPRSPSSSSVPRGSEVAASTTARGGNLWATEELVDLLPALRRPSVLALELTSSHLCFMRTSPDVAVITGFWPDHLELHGSLGAYRAAKETIVRHQAAESWVVVNEDDPAAASFAALTPAQRASFSLRGRVERGAFLEDDRVVACWDGVERSARAFGRAAAGGRPAGERAGCRRGCARCGGLAGRPPGRPCRPRAATIPDPRRRPRQEPGLRSSTTDSRPHQRRQLPRWRHTLIGPWC